MSEETQSITPSSGINYNKRPGGQPQTQYISESPIQDKMDLLFQSPSIPPSLRNQYYAFWEDIKTGNYKDSDIAYLMAKFKQWCALLMWYIPEQRWGNIILFADFGEEGLEPINLEMDINQLINILEQFFFMNLTKGREGFFTKELNTIRQHQESSYSESLGPSGKKTLRMF